MRIRKAVITAAGWGTRFLPATKALPKEMLPLLNKPMIQYAVEEAIDSGIEQFAIVISMGKHAVEDHFDRSLQLERILHDKGLGDILEHISNIGESVNIFFIRQREQLGLGHAVWTTRDFVGDEPFALLLPDDIIASKVPVTKQLISAFENYRCSVLAVEEVAEELVSSYGIVKPRPVDSHVSQILGLIEKPEVDQAPSRLAIVGRYILTPEIFGVLEQTLPGKNGEVQLTDALRHLLSRQHMFGYQFDGTRYDCGTPLGLLKASIAFALEDSGTADDLRRYLADIQLQQELPSSAGGVD